MSQTVKEKTCKHCAVTSKVAAFARNRRECKPCYSNRLKKWVSENKEHKAKNDAIYNSKPENKLRRRDKYANGGAEKIYRNMPNGRSLAMWYTLKKGAEKRGITFEITKDWILEKLNKGKCEVTGIPFVFQPEFDSNSVKVKDQYRNPFSPSVDRIESAKGYTEDNCQVVVCIYNFAKGPFQQEALKVFCEAYLDKHG